MDKNLALMAVGVSTMTSLLLVRSTYRIIELSGGWSGPIISTRGFSVRLLTITSRRKMLTIVRSLMQIRLMVL
jgi:hypothetical protein